MAGSHDGRVTLSTKLDTSGIQAGAKGIKTALATSCKAVMALGAAAATAIAAVTKQSVDAYAAFEQLTGGVETLFKESADKVKAYAEDAYKTAGVSANAYMEAVTSFSASLISSLGGDTAKAAEVANMAMVDMSDNANKMGTPLANIQTAYQGFAKQNYTMLDNLKLGYGGTKTEMERLLKDAEAFSGVKYDISNLSDVYEAIHQIQVKLGVAGTTAKEAESTITGSLTMTKSAWENLLAAMSGGGSLDRAIDDFVNSLEKAMQNILPVVERSLVGIGYAIERLAPKLVERIAVALIKAIPSLLNAVYKMVIGLAQGIYQGILALFTDGTTEVLEEQAEKIEESVENQKDLTEEVKETEKAAKKALAGFDELNVLTQDTAEYAGAGLDTSGFATGVSAEAVSVTADVKDNVSPAIQSIIGKVMHLIAPLRDIDFSPVMDSFNRLGETISNFGLEVRDALEWVWFNILVPLGEWSIEEAAPAGVDALSAAFESLSTAFDIVAEPAKELWENTLKPMFEQLGTWIIDIINQTAESFEYLSEKLVEYKDEIGMVVEGIGFILGLIWSMISPIIGSAVEGIGNVLKTTIDFIFSIIQAVGNFFSFFKNIFLAVVELFKGNFDEAEKYAKLALANFVNIFVGIANSIISVINNLWSLIFDAFKGTVNSVGGLVSKIGEWIGFDWDLKWDAKAPLIPTIPKYVPQLARGAVLPANKPFLAMVGDQRHGTNIEAPLTTIQEAVAAVMNDHFGGMMAGFEALLDENQRLRRVVEGIELGDSTIGQAANRYNQKMAIIKGG